jgi:hypothetical protein
MHPHRPAVATPCGTPAGGTLPSRTGAATSVLTWRGASMSTAAWRVPGTTRLRQHGGPDGPGSAGIFAKMPGLAFGHRVLTPVLPFERMIAGPPESSKIMTGHWRERPAPGLTCGTKGHMLVAKITFPHGRAASIAPSLPGQTGGSYVQLRQLCVFFGP